MVHQKRTDVEHCQGRRLPLLGLIVLAVVLSVCPALADGLQVTSPWLRATPKNASVAGGYATITNTGTTPDRLLGGSLPMAPEGQVHSMSMTNDVMHMSRLDQGLAIAPGAIVRLTPGGDHLMFLNPKAPLKEGDIVKGSLRFEKAGTIAVTFPVAGIGAKAAPNAPASGDMGDMPGMDMKGN